MRRSVQAIEVRQPDPNMWRWRIYLPNGKRYKISEFAGQLPPRGKLTNREWLSAMQSAQYNGSGEFSSDAISGEFTMEASLLRVDGGWRLKTHPGGGPSTYPFTDDWPADPRYRRSDVWQDTQRILNPGEPILLLYLSKPVKTRRAGRWIFYQRANQSRGRHHALALAVTSELMQHRRSVATW